ncbi:MAG TPA: hypothetical protein VJX66_10675 [Amycolatopsis sp.]|nr:hypothetical protein [Amycolatopsis sp.]
MSSGRIRWAILAAAAAVAGLLAATGWLAPGYSGAAQPGGCTVLQVETEHEEGPTTLRRLEIPSGTTESLVQVRFWINAIGYSPAQGLYYGIADGTIDGRFRDGAHAVAIKGQSQMADFGPVGRAGERQPRWSMLTGATAGTITGDTWYVLRGDDLFTVDIRQGSPDYLKVVRRIELRPSSLAEGVDDIEFDPADGLLYAVSVSHHGEAVVVTIDPASGKVKTLPALRFPAASAYGSVVIGPDDALYATANRIGQRSVTYRLPRDGSSPAAEIASGPGLVSSDAAGCLGLVPIPSMSSPEPTELPPTTTTETTPAPTTTTETSTASPAPPPPPPPTTLTITVAPALPPVALPPPKPPSVVPPPIEQPVPTPTPTPTPTPSTTHPSVPHHAEPTAKPVAAPADRAAATKVKRRWALTSLLLILGGSAAAMALRRYR